MSSSGTSVTHDGYPGLGNFMGKSIDSGIAMFHTFPELNMRSILCMQAELLNLESQLQAQTEFDRRTLDPISQSYERNVRNMMQSNCPQWLLMLEIREKLKEYNNALLAQAALANMSRPEQANFKSLKHWLLNPGGGNQFLQGCEARPWKDIKGLVSISNGSTKDSFTSWLELKLYPWLHGQMVQRRKKPVATAGNAGLIHYNDKVFSTIARITNVLLSILIPSLTVVGLYFIKALAARLIAVICFSSLFSVVLAVFTRARPIEIFTATAAFAAVQVVFVGSTTVDKQFV